MKLVCYVACLCVAGARTRGICFANALCSRCVGFGLLFAKFFMPWWHYSVELRASFWEEPYPEVLASLCEVLGPEMALYFELRTSFFGEGRVAQWTSLCEVLGCRDGACFLNYKLLFGEGRIAQ